MRILIGCDDFQLRTGMPMYVLNMAKELKRRGHEVAVISFLTGLGDADGIKQYNYYTYDPTWFTPDVLVLNEPRSARLLPYYRMVPAYNIIHSPRSNDEPITGSSQIRKYIAVKQEDYRYILSKGINKKIVERIPLPVDVDWLRSWKPAKQKIAWDIVSISTFDEWRRPMLLDLIDQAKKGKLVLLLGEDQGALGDLKKIKVPGLQILSRQVDDVRHYIAQSAMVASLFEGTVAVEAWAMGKPTMIYDLKGKSFEVKPGDRPVDKHDVKSVVDRYLDIFNEKWADIIIPHIAWPKNIGLLKKCVKSIPRNYNVIVANYGGSFAENCNQGAKLAKNDTLIFMNDDMEANPIALWQMLDNPAHVCGARTIYPDGREQWLGIGLRWHGVRKQVEYFLPNDNRATYASGGLFRIGRELFIRLNMFDEGYINGGEDQDLMLRAMERGHTMGFAQDPTIHHLSTSENRFTHCDQNEARERSQWLDKIERLKNVYVFNVKKLSTYPTHTMVPKVKVYY